MSAVEGGTWNSKIVTMLCYLFHCIYSSR